MKLRIHTLLLTLGALALSATTASAQFTALLTEAPVTIQAAITTETTPTAGATRTVTTRVTQANFLQDLLDAGIITGGISGWSLVAVSAAPADLAHVNGEFTLYAVKGGARVLVPASKLGAASYGSVEKYTERHQGQYVLSSKGTVTNHVSYGYAPRIVVAGTTYTADEGISDGFATIQYVAKDFDSDYEVFFYAISSLRVTALGSFRGTQRVGSGTPAAAEGLYTLTLSVGAARLVPASLYPAVTPY